MKIPKVEKSFSVFVFSNVGEKFESVIQKKKNLVIEINYFTLFIIFNLEFTEMNKRDIELEFKIYNANLFAKLFQQNYIKFR